MNPIGRVTRAPKLHSRHRPSRKTSKILLKLTCQPLASLSLVSSQRTGRDRYTAVSRPRPTLRRRSPTSVGRTNDQHWPEVTGRVECDHCMNREASEIRTPSYIMAISEGLARIAPFPRKRLSLRAQQ